MSRRCRVLSALLLGAVVMALCWAASSRLLRAAAQWLDVGEYAQRADYVMVLNGAEDTRPFAAAAIVAGGWASRVLIAEVAPSGNVIDGIVPPCHECNRTVLLKRGVAADRITILPGAAATTYDEAKALAAFLKNRPHARVLVVTNDWHTRRSRWVVARVLGDRADQIAFVSAPSDDFPLDAWWRSPMGFESILSEYLKLLFYAASYGCLLHWLAACAVLALVAAWIRRRESAGNQSPA